MFDLNAASVLAESAYAAVDHAYLAHLPFREDPAAFQPLVLPCLAAH